MVSRSDPGTALPEPALRPRGTRSHAVDTVRHSRIYGRGTEVVVRDRRLRERRYPLGEGGIVRAEFVPPAESGTAAKSSSADRWGVVDFKGADGKAILRVPLAEWLPESGLVGSIDLSPSECFDRTGLRRLVADLGIPLEEESEPQEPAPLDKESDARPDRAIHRDLPAWHNWTRGIGALVWFTFFLLIPMTGNGSRWTALVAAAGLFLLPGTDLAVRLVLWSRGRKDTSLTRADVVVPSPEAGAGATHRFRDTASVHVLPGDVVLTNTLGEERWLPRSGPHGVTRLVRLLEPSSGNVLGVEFRDGGNATRALFPWRWWFAGPEGPEAWSRLVAALGVPVSDEKARRPQGSDSWWRDHTMAADARKMSPMGGKDARRATSWHSSVIGGGEPIVVPIFSLFLLPGLASNQVPAQVTGILAALTVAAELVPVIAHHITSRFKLDRPAEPESL
jgi:hypothetical protein